MARWWFNRQGSTSAKQVTLAVIAATHRKAQRDKKPRAAVKVYVRRCERCGHEFNTVNPKRRFHSTGCESLTTIERNSVNARARLRVEKPQAIYIKKDRAVVDILWKKKRTAAQRKKRMQGQRVFHTMDKVVISRAARRVRFKNIGTE